MKSRRWRTFAIVAPGCRSSVLSAVLIFLVVVVGVVSLGMAEEPDASRMEFFEQKIRPVLAAHCYECHSARSDEVKGGLLLDTKGGLLRGGDSGPAIVAGDAGSSLLIQAVRYDGLEMPPSGKLPEAVIADLERWVLSGAPDPREGSPAVPGHSPPLADARQFWSFQPVTAPPLPQVSAASWPKNAIDVFVLARLEQAGLRPVAPADKRTLIRRASFDLLGLPPTPDEIEVFLRDDSPEAFSRVVDRLLASPHYGERWGRHWLDVARYGEDQAHSFKPRLYPSGFRYRDWLIDAYNQDKPYDRFIVEQVAADLLDEPGRMERLPALGFFALGPVYYGDKLQFDQLDDRIDTLTRGMLGLTVACARCHDHKYDPISTGDYYSLAGIFASSRYVEVPLVADEVVQRYDQGQQTIKDQQDKIERWLAAEAERLGVPAKQVEKSLPQESRAELEQMRSELKEFERSAPPMYPVAHAISEGDIHNLRINLRGNPETPGDEVPRRFLAILSGEHAAVYRQKSGRLEMARAIASPDNPLTARVMANRIWQHLFGRGIVASTSNFGNLGQRPSHPELLDYLASRFVAGGWSVKTLQREIMLSAAYQSSCQYDEANHQRDAENLLLWRMNRRRLDVEPWRDAMLAVSDQLDATIGGPSFDLSSGDNHRRTLYAKVSRHDLDSLLRLFDFPDPNITADSRSTTTVPLQQLFVLNSRFIVDCAEGLVRRLSRQCEADDSQRIGLAHLLLFGRNPSDSEIQRGLRFIHGGADRDQRWRQYAQMLLAANEFLYLD